MIVGTGMQARLRLFAALRWCYQLLSGIQQAVLVDARNQRSC
jgi:hypothetical protein